MRRLGAVAALALAGCQTFGAFSEPTTLPAGAMRVGVAAEYDAYQVTDERLTAGDVAFSLGYGLSDAAELDALIAGSTLEARLKYAFVRSDHFALAGIAGAGFFTTYGADTTAFYLPAQLVAGVRPAPDVVIFAGPSAWGAAGLSSETLGAGFNRGSFGLLGGGVAGVGFEGSALTFCPQVTVMTPLVAGAGGTVTQVSFGFGTTVR